MARINATLALVASFLALSQAQTSLQTTAQCQAAGFSAQQCGLCPYDPINPQACASYDAGFDDLPDTGAIPTYKDASWPGFSVLTQTQAYNATTIGPYTNRHYAAVMPGQVGSMKFGQTGGLGSQNTPSPAVGALRYFHYACASPNVMDPPLPVKCKITVTASCLASGASDPVNGPFKPFSATINYDPATVDRTNPLTKTGMAYQSLDFSTTFGSGQGLATPQRCSNYSFSAEGTDFQTTTGPGGTIVIPGLYPGPVLLLDDIFYSTYYKNNAPYGCGNTGINWAYYNSTFGGNPQDGRWAVYNPQSVKTVRPVYQNTYNTLGGGFGSATPVAIYNSGTTALSTDFFLLDHTTYFLAPQSGNYTFTFNQVDDILDFWEGPNAYRGWTRANANFESLYTGGFGPSTFVATLVAGQYYPIRYMVGGGGPPNGLARTTITGPGGTVLAGSGVTNSPWLVRYSCDGTTAPPFPAFGAET